MLADMVTEIDAARMLAWQAAWLGKNGQFKNAEGSMAKLKAGRVATWATERAIQILGGYGYTSTQWKGGIRDAKSTTFWKAQSKFSNW